jgi:hypothetical protein
MARASTVAGGRLRGALCAAAAAAAAAAAPAATAGAAAPAATLLWQLHDPAVVFGSAGVSLQGGAAAATFAVGADFGSGYAAVGNATGGASAPPAFLVDAAALVPGCSQCAVYVDAARHVAPAAPPSPPAVDTFALVVGAGACTVFGFVSAGAGATGTPAWSTALKTCTAGAGTGAAYRCLAASDDGSTVAVQGYGADPGIVNTTARAYVLDGATGKLRYEYDLKAREAAGQGDVTVTPDGAWVAYVNEDSSPTPNSAQLHVLDGRTGALRAEVAIPFFIAAAVSPSGAYVFTQNFTHLVGSQGWISKWNGTGYALSHRINAPWADEYDIWDVSTTTTAAGREVAVVGWISAPSVLGVRVTAHDFETGALLTDWSAPVSSKFQNNPTISAAGDYIGLALWGDAGETPTAALLRVGSNSTLFTHVSPGSMFGVDVGVVPGGGAGGGDAVYLAVAGKQVPANVLGNGGDAYAFRVDVPAA